MNFFETSYIKKIYFNEIVEDKNILFLALKKNNK